MDFSRGVFLPPRMVSYIELKKSKGNFLFCRTCAKFYKTAAIFSKASAGIVIFVLNIDEICLA